MRILVLGLFLLSLIGLSISMQPSYVGHNLNNKNINNLEVGDIWTNCGKSGDHFTISSVTIKPDPPVKNSAVTITASGTLNEDLTDGKVRVVVKYGFLVVFNTTESLCSSTFNPVGCPIKAGPYSRTVTTPVIPQQAPMGKYEGNVVVLDQNNQEVACVNVAFILK